MLACFAAATGDQSRPRARSVSSTAAVSRARGSPIEWRLVARNVVLALAARIREQRLLDGHQAIRSAGSRRRRAGVAVVVLHFALSAVWALDTSRAAAFKRR